MKRITVLVIFLAGFILVVQPSSCFATRFIFGPASTIINGRSNASAVKPGDTIYLSASSRLTVELRNIHGTAAKPVLIQNYQGQVFFNSNVVGIKFDTCSWVQLIGKRADTTYGFVISGASAGIDIGGLSTCIEVAGIEISNITWTGITCKTDPDCTFKSTRDNFIMRNISIHDNYLHQIANEGMYIGDSFFSGYPIKCNGKDTVLYPHLIRNIRIYNNKVENTGWDGIQVSCADSACFVNNNFIFHDSQAGVNNQMSGFMLGGGSSCNCFSNFIKNGKGDGIDEMGQGGNYIYNNLIVNPGQSFTGSGQKHGIFVGTQAPAAGRGYNLVFNTIVSPKTNGIDFRSTAAVNSIASDNIVANPGGSYIKPATGTTLTTQNNLLVAAVSDVKFINSSQDNFDLLPSSPAVNTGIAISGFNLNFDNIGRLRPWPWKYDIGAFECHDSSLLSINEKVISPEFDIIHCYYKSGILNVVLCFEKKEILTADVYSMQGVHISTLCNSEKGPGIVEFEKFVGRLDEACYICIFRFAGSSISRKIYAGSFN